MLIDIETPRLLLRRWEASDLDILAKINADPHVMRYFPETYSEERTKRVYGMIQEEFSERGYGFYAAQEKSSGNFMGYIGFHWATQDVDFCPCVEIGWRIDKEYWNKGYATEGAKACLEYGFSHLGFEKVYSFTSIKNIPSQRVMQKIGMLLYRQFKHPEITAAHPLQPHICYVIQSPTLHAPATPPGKALWPPQAI